MADEEPLPPIKDASADPRIPSMPNRDVFPSPPEIHFQRPELLKKPVSEQRHVVAPNDSTVRIGAGLGAGVTFAASIIAGVIIGQWVDHRWNHTSFPWGTLIFTLLGLAAGFLNLFRLLGVTDRNKRQ